MPEPSTRSGPTWQTLRTGGMGVLIGVLGSVLIHKNTDLQETDLVGLALGVAALVLALVGWSDQRHVSDKIDTLTSMTAYQHGRMQVLGDEVQNLVRRGGGTLFIPTGTMLVEGLRSPKRKRTK